MPTENKIITPSPEQTYTYGQLDRPGGISKAAAEAYEPQNPTYDHNEVSDAASDMLEKHGIQPEQRLTGRVAFFNEERGFGFIDIDGSSCGDIFVHVGDIDIDSIPDFDNYRGLVRGETVEFRAVPGRHNRLKALEVTGAKRGKLTANSRPRGIKHRPIGPTQMHHNRFGGPAPHMAPYPGFQQQQYPRKQPNSYNNGAVPRTGWQSPYYRSSMVQLPVPPRRRDAPASPKVSSISPEQAHSRRPITRSPPKSPRHKSSMDAFLGRSAFSDLDADDLMKPFSAMSMAQSVLPSNTSFPYPTTPEALDAALSSPHTSDESPRKPLSPARILRINGGATDKWTAPPSDLGWSRYNGETSATKFDDRL